MKIGDKLYRIRIERELSQENMAGLLNKTQSSYSRLENNQSSPTLEDMVRFSKSLEIPIEFFLSENITTQAIASTEQIENDKSIQYKGSRKIYEDNSRLKQENLDLREQIKAKDKIIALLEEKLYNKSL